MTRRGTTMVEALGVITISTIVLSSLGGTLYRAMLQSHAAQRSVDIQRTAARLSRTFRSDVHRTQQVDGVVAEIELKGPGNSTVYAWVAHRLERTQTAGQRIHRDVFVFPAGCQGRFAVVELDASSAPARLVQLWLELRDPLQPPIPPEASSSGSQFILLEAAVRGDGRFVEPSL